MRKALLVIDDVSVYMQKCKLQQLTNKIRKENIQQIDLFALTSNTRVIAAIKKHLEQAGVKIIELPSAVLINAAVKVMQKNIHKWANSLGNTVVGHKNLKEWFLLPDRKVSSWWFSLLAEKNTNQSHVFFQIAQINAVTTSLKTNSYQYFFLALTNHEQRFALQKIAKNLELTVINIFMKKRKFLPSLKISFNAIFILFKWFFYSCYIKIILPNRRTRLVKENPFLFVTYFPHVEPLAAKQGIFRNRYGEALQDKMQAMQIPITWLTMPLAYHGYSLFSAIKLTKGFIQNGERMFVLYEFFSTRILLKSLYWWSKQNLLARWLFSKLDKNALVQIWTEPECLPLVKKLWRLSFNGPVNMRGIIFYLTYCEVFKTFSKSKHCLYYCEMQSWEKALNAAKRQYAPATQTLGYQHTIIMRNLFHYFYHANDLQQNAKPIDLPLPDKLIANGPFMQELFCEWYPKLYQAEAVRQLYMQAVIDKPISLSIKKPILLVIGAYDPHETKAILSMVYEAFPFPQPFEIWFKSYPTISIETLWKELQIDANLTQYKVVDEPIEKILPQVNSVFVPGSTVAVEALVYGCEVIVPLLPDVLQLNPLADFAADCIFVHSPAQLKTCVLQCMKAPKRKTNPKDFISHYWNLDPKLPLWERIFSD